MIIKILVSLLVVLGAGFIGSQATMPSIPTWYATLNKPSFNPPNWIFGPVWTTLYILMAVAAAVVWNRGLKDPKVKAGLTFFLTQLALNSLWSILFFGLHLPFWALVDIIFLWLAIVLTIGAFKKVSPAAAWLLFPYICWVSFAAVLNLAIVILN